MALQAARMLERASGGATHGTAGAANVIATMQP